MEITKRKKNLRIFGCACVVCAVITASGSAAQVSGTQVNGAVVNGVQVNAAQVNMAQEDGAVGVAGRGEEAVQLFDIPQEPDALHSFTDLPASHWAYSAVMEMAGAGVVQGYPDGSFRPTGVVTYGEFIKMAVAVGSGATAEAENGAAAGSEAAEREPGSDTAAESGMPESEPVSGAAATGSGAAITEAPIGAEAAGNDGFTEVPESGAAGTDAVAAHWAGPYYEEGLEQGWFTTWDISKKSLEQPIPRALMALICTGILGSEPPDDYSLLLDGISDVQAGSPYEYEIVLAYGEGLLAGYPDGSFRPQGTLTRAEAAAVISRLAAATATGVAAAPPADAAALPIDLPTDQAAALPSPNDTSGAAQQSANILDPDTGTPFPPSVPAVETDSYGYTIFDEPYQAGITFREENRADGYQRVDYAAGDSYEYNPPDLSDVKLLIIYNSAAEDTSSQQIRLRAALEMEIPAWSREIEEDFFQFLATEKEKYRMGLRLCAYGDRLVLMNRYGDSGHLQIMSEDCSGPAWELAPGEVRQELF